MKIGDWVKATNYCDETFIGYITGIDKVHGVYHIVSTNPAVNGLTSVYDVEPIEYNIHKDDLSVLIDLALDTNDEAWFNELIKLQEVDKKHEKLSKTA